jgi:hypothetical protein
VTIRDIIFIFFRAISTIAAPAVFGALFGIAGGGLTARKLKRRVGKLEDFQFESLYKGGFVSAEYFVHHE